MIESFKPQYNATLRPLARLLLTLHIHPNAITVFSLVLFFIAGWLTGIDQWIAACAAILVGSGMDGLDGVVAREGRCQTTFGAILDSSLDRMAEILWISGVMFYYTQHPLTGIANAGVYLAFLALTGSIMISYVKARCEGAGIVCKEGILQRPERLIVICLSLLLGPKAMPWGLGIIALVGYATVIQRLRVAYREGARKDCGVRIAESKKPELQSLSASELQRGKTLCL
jgi:CDP-diacylglycerol--glycerol-3-phosphate 3-phosphatidyltransferase